MVLVLSVRLTIRAPGRGWFVIGGIENELNDPTDASLQANPFSLQQTSKRSLKGRWTNHDVLK